LDDTSFIISGKFHLIFYLIFTDFARGKHFFHEIFVKLFTKEDASITFYASWSFAAMHSLHEKGAVFAGMKSSLRILNRRNASAIIKKKKVNLEAP